MKNYKRKENREPNFRCLNEQHIEYLKELMLKEKYMH